MGPCAKSIQVVVVVRSLSTLSVVQVCVKGRPRDIKQARVGWGSAGRGLALSSDCLSEVTRSEPSRLAMSLCCFAC